MRRHFRYSPQTLLDTGRDLQTHADTCRPPRHVQTPQKHSTDMRTHSTDTTQTPPDSRRQYLISKYLKFFTL